MEKQIAGHKALSTKDGLGVYNVTFEPDPRNNWHIHHN